MEKIDLPRIVIDQNFTIVTVTEVIVLDKKSGASSTVEYTNFIDSYEEYHDPKDIRIRALEDELKALKEKHKPVRKKRRKLLDGEITEIKELIRKGQGNTEIGKEYDCSDSTVSRFRLELRKAGEDV